MSSLRFVLVRPAYPSNIGATARAMKTMGLSDLALVDPLGNHKSERSMALAKHAHDVLDQAKIFDSLCEATQDCDLVVGTTTRQRYIPGEAMTAKQLSHHLEEKADLFPKVALVFGPESTGLSNDELQQCDIRATIPMANEHPSLNLAQAIMIFAYELSSGTRAFPGSRTPKKERRNVDPAEYKTLQRDLGRILTGIGIGPEHDQHHEMIAKIHHLKRSDLYLLFNLRNHLESKLDLH